MKPALLIIDVQSGLFRTEPPPGEADAVIQRINRVATRARKHKVPVILIQHEQTGSDVAFGCAGWELDHRLQVDDSDIRIRKTTPDSFLRTNLGEVLVQASVDHLVVCGYASEFCVDTTVRRGASLGYSITLVADAHTTHDKAHLNAAAISAHHNATLVDISSFGPEIVALPAASLWI